MPPYISQFKSDSASTEKMVQKTFINAYNQCIKMNKGVLNAANGDCAFDAKLKTCFKRCLAQNNVKQSF